MKRWELEVEGQGHAVIHVTGRVSAKDATGLLATVREAQKQGHGAVELDLSHASGAIDVLASRVQEGLSADPLRPQVELTGLNQHYQRLLDYLGVR